MNCHEMPWTDIIYDFNHYKEEVKNPREEYLMNVLWQFQLEIVEKFLNNPFLLFYFFSLEKEQINTV